MDLKTVAVPGTGMLGRIGPADDPQETVAGAPEAILCEGLRRP